MLTRYPDLVGGLMLTGVEAAAALYALGHYDLGQLRFVGPGMFPLATGVLLAVLGLAVAAGGLKAAAEEETVEWASLARVVLAIAAFGLLIGPFGVVPAVVGLTAVAMADRRPGSWKLTLATAVGLALIGFAFKTGFGLRVAILAWPF